MYPNHPTCHNSEVEEEGVRAPPFDSVRQDVFCTGLVLTQSTSSVNLPYDQVYALLKTPSCVFAFVEILCRQRDRDFKVGSQLAVVVRVQLLA